MQNQIFLNYQKKFIYKTNEYSPNIKSTFSAQGLKKFGTVSFSHLARDGFVAATILKSAVKKGDNLFNCYG